MSVAPHASWLSTRGYLRRRPFLVVLAAVVLATCLLSFMQFRLYDGMRMGMRDLGFTLQSFDNLLRERPFIVRLGYTSNTATSHVQYAGWEERTVFTEHLYLTLGQFLPLYLLFRSPYPLFVAQAAWVAAAAIPLFLLARRRLGHEWLAAGIAVAYLLQPGVQIAALGMYIYGPHMDSSMPLFLFGMLYFADARRPRAFWLMGALALVTIESIAPVVAAIGVYATLVRHAWWRHGLGIVVLATAYFLLCALVFIPWAWNGAPRSSYYFAALQAIPVLWRHPDMLAPLGNAVLTLAGGIGLPLAFLPFFAPAVWLIAAPEAVTGMLAFLIGYTVPLELGSWHIWPYMVAAFLGLISVLGHVRRRSARLTSTAMLLSLPAAIAGAFLYGPYPFSRDVYPAAYDVDPSKLALVQLAGAEVPHEASLSVEFFLGSHFAERPNIYWFPVNWRHADYVLVDAGTWAWWSDDDASTLSRVQHSGSMQLQWQKGKVFLFRRVPDPPVETRLSVTFDNGLELSGYSVSPGTMRSGDTITLTLFWRAPAGPLAPSLPNLTVFNHLVYPDGRVIAQRDNQPDNGTYPMSDWAAGETVVDRYRIHIPPDAVAGRYVFETGLYDPATGKRLMTIGGADLVRLPMVIAGN